MAKKQKEYVLISESEGILFFKNKEQLLNELDALQLPEDDFQVISGHNMNEQSVTTFENIEYGYSLDEK
jgi:hypothetical protein